jgi:hypothetical protein
MEEIGCGDDPSTEKVAKKPFVDCFSGPDAEFITIANRFAQSTVAQIGELSNEAILASRAGGLEAVRDRV